MMTKTCTRKETKKEKRLTNPIGAHISTFLNQFLVSMEKKICSSRGNKEKKNYVNGEKWLWDGGIFTKCGSKMNIPKV